MTEGEKLRTRILIAQSVGVNPDDCVHNYEDMGAVFAIKYKGYDLVMGFAIVPTIAEAREQIKSLYLSGLELQFDEEMAELGTK